MNRYVATFHTHLSALLTFRTLEQKGISAWMAPVPRRLSSSCGTCVFYEADLPCADLMDADAERIYRTEDESYFPVDCM